MFRRMAMVEKVKRLRRAGNGVLREFPVVPLNV
jgi:hypothetical protein